MKNRREFLKSLAATALTSSTDIVEMPRKHRYSPWPFGIGADTEWVRDHPNDPFQTTKPRLNKEQTT